MLPYSFCKALGTTQLTGKLISLIRALEGEKEHAQQDTQHSEAIKARLATTLQFYAVVTALLLNN